MLEIGLNRKAKKWTAGEQIGRVLWAVAYPALFRSSPRPFWIWRRCILRLFGAKIGRGVHVYPTVAITMPWNLQIGNLAAVGDRVILYALGRIAIGKSTTISQHAHLCAGTHDHNRADMALVKSEIEIGDGAWICADSFIGPDVEVGDYAIVGARAVVVRNIEPWMIVAGNPARPIGRRRIPSLINSNSVEMLR